MRSFEFSTHHTMARKPPSEAAVRALVPAPHGFVCALCHAASTGVPDTGFPLTDAGDDACASCLKSIVMPARARMKKDDPTRLKAGLQLRRKLVTARAKLALFEAGAVVADDPDDAAEARAEDGQ